MNRHGYSHTYPYYSDIYLSLTAVVAFVEGDEDQNAQENRVVIRKNGMLGRGGRGAGGIRTYGEGVRSFRRFGGGKCFRAEPWTLEGVATSFDAGRGGSSRYRDLLYGSQAWRQFNVITDSQTATARMRDNRAGPGYEKAVRGIRLAKELFQRQATLSIRWVPGYAGVLGNEIADMWATDASAREERTRIGSSRIGGSRGCASMQGTKSMTFLKTQLKKKAAREWREEIIRRSQGRRSFRVPAEGERPRIPPGLQRTPKELASRFFQLSSEHAMIAPFLKEKFGWVESDGCWWSGGGRQSRKHLFKECRTWKDVIRKLWTEVGEISGSIRDTSQGEIYKGRKGFCFGMDKKAVRPGNTSVRKLLSEERFVEAVLDFLECTGVGRVKQGVMLDR